MKHLLPAWLPLLLLITFLGCQSMQVEETEPPPQPDFEIVNGCSPGTKVFARKKQTYLVYCAEILVNGRKKLIVKNLQVLQKIKHRQYHLVYKAENFQQFEFNLSKSDSALLGSKTKNTEARQSSTIKEVLLISLNNRYEVLHLTSLEFLCNSASCLTVLQPCSQSEARAHFPYLAYRIKNMKRENENERSRLLQQLVNQAMSGDKLAQDILTKYEQWFSLSKDDIRKFNHYKKIIDSNLKNRCIKDNDLLVWNLN